MFSVTVNFEPTTKKSPFHRRRGAQPLHAAQGAVIYPAVSGSTDSA